MFGQATSHLERDARRLLLCLPRDKVDMSKVRSHGTIELSAEGDTLCESYKAGAATVWATLTDAEKKKALPGTGSCGTSGAVGSSGTAGHA